MHGGALCYRRDLWVNNPFPDLDVAEDCRFLWGGLPKNIRYLEDNRFFVGLIHAGNTSPKRTGDPRWQPRPSGEIRALMGEDWERYAGLCAG